MDKYLKIEKEKKRKKKQAKEKKEDDGGRKNACTKLGMNASLQPNVDEALRVDQARKDHDHLEEEKKDARQAKLLENAGRMHAVATRFLQFQQSSGGWHGRLSADELKVLLKMVGNKTTATSIGTLEGHLDDTINRDTLDVVIEKIKSNQIVTLLSRSNNSDDSSDDGDHD